MKKIIITCTSIKFFNWDSVARAGLLCHQEQIGLLKGTEVIVALNGHLSARWPLVDTLSADSESELNQNDLNSFLKLMRNARKPGFASLNHKLVRAVGFATITGPKSNKYCLWRLGFASVSTACVRGTC